MPTGTQAKGPETPGKRTQSKRNEKPQVTSPSFKAGSASTAVQAGWAEGRAHASHILPKDGGEPRGRRVPQSATHSTGFPRPPRPCRAERYRQAQLLRFSCFLKGKKNPWGNSASQTLMSQRHRSN